ncbi:MAG TPA: PKD domain-containing protein, partial [Nitrospiria bacterium]
MVFGKHYRSVLKPLFLTTSLLTILFLYPEIAFSQTVNIVPTGKVTPLDDSSDDIADIQADDAGGAPVGRESLGDGQYTLRRTKVMAVTNFDVSSIPGGSTITDAVLHLQYGTEAGNFTATNSVRYDNGGGLFNTSIQPVNTNGVWSPAGPTLDEQFNLFAVGVDTLTELQNLVLEYTNNGGGGSKGLSFDYLYIEVIYSLPNQAPDGVIDTPVGNVTITEGESVNFTGTGTDPDNNLPLTFLWDFNGGATNSTAEDSGAVTFSTAGVHTVTFTVTDSLGLADPTPDTRTITVNANQAPNGVIDTPATNVTINVGQSVSFTGTGTDPDNHTPFSFLWDFNGGATNSTAEDPGAVTFSTAGVYTVTFTVTDSLGLSDPTPDTRTITVNANQAPNGVIDTPATNVTINVGQSVSFTGTGTDPDNNLPLTFLWDFGGGATNSTAEDPGVVIFNTPGIYNVTFTVTDSLGLADGTPDTRTITVNANQAPNGVIDTPLGNVTINEGQSVSFTGTGTDPDNNLPLTFLWNFGGGATNSTAEDPGAVTFSTAGVYTVTFTVTDSLGLADPTPDTRTITVNAPPNGVINTPAGNVTITEGEAVTFTGTGSDPDNNLPLTFLWNFNGGATNSTAEDPGTTTFNTPGIYTVTFTVTDSLGLADPIPDTRTVTVNANQAPNGVIDTPLSNVTITEGQSVSFTGNGTDPDNNLPLTFLWDFNGGATNSTVEDPGAVTFNTAGVYTVTFTVT